MTVDMPRPRVVVSMMCSDSGVVIRTCGDLRIIRARADCGVSPVRTATRSWDSSPAIDASRGVRWGMVSIPTLRSIAIYESQIERLFDSRKAMAEAVRGHAARVGTDGRVPGRLAERYWVTTPA